MKSKKTELDEKVVKYLHSHELQIY